MRHLLQWRATILGTATLDSAGNATLTIPTPTVLPDTLSATYQGNTQLTTSSANLAVSVPTFAQPGTSATTFLVGQSGTFTETASGNPTPTYSITSGTLPAGLQFNTTTGVLSGTPTQDGNTGAGHHGDERGWHGNADANRDRRPSAHVVHERGTADVDRGDSHHLVRVHGPWVSRLADVQHHVRHVAGHRFAARPDDGCPERHAGRRAAPSPSR